MVGLTNDTIGSPGFTVNPFSSDADSVPVVSVTVRKPTTAPGSIVMRAVALVGVLTISCATEIPVPKLAVVTLCAKCVNCPVMFTFSV